MKSRTFPLGAVLGHALAFSSPYLDLTWREEGLNDKGTSRPTCIQYQQQPSSQIPSLQGRASVFRFPIIHFALLCFFSVAIRTTTFPLYKLT
jgi:hypothetical protein